MTRKPKSSEPTPKRPRTEIDDIHYTTNSPAKLCWWCSHQVVSAIQCPISYTPPRISKIEISEITRDTCDVVQDIPSTRLEEINIGARTTKTNGTYTSIGTFCSRHCALAYADANSHDSLHIDSRSLIMKQLLEDGVSRTITPAPHWSLLEAFGGTMTIDEFRATFDAQLLIPIESVSVNTPLVHVFTKYNLIA